MSGNSYTEEIYRDGGKMTKKGSYNNDWEKLPTVKEISKYKSGDWKERGLSKETLEHFGVKVSYDEEFGSMGDVDKVYFPYYNQNGKLVGYKIRHCTVDKDEKRSRFSVVGEVSVKHQLFGQKQARKSAKKVFITESESDTMSIYQALVNSQKGTKFEAYTPAVVNINCGNPNGVQSIAHNEDYVTKHDEIILCFDNDERNPVIDKESVIKGKECTQNVGAFLANHKVSEVPWPEDINDANDYLKKGKENALAKMVMYETIPFKADKMKSISEITIEDILKPKEQGIEITSLPLLNEKTYGLRTGELTVITSYSGSGKSFLVNELGYHLMKAGEKVCYIFLEETFSETIRRVIARKLHINNNKFQFDPLRHATEEQIMEAKEWFDGKCVISDVFGNMMISELMNKIRSAVFIEGCSYVIIDHLSLLMSNATISDERRSMDLLMTELASFVAQHPVGILAVSHLNRQAIDEIGKISSMSDEFKWAVVKKENMRSSASLEQLAFTVLGLDMQIRKDRQRGLVRVTVLKNRPIGILGNADVFKSNEDTGLIELYPNEEE